MRLDDFKNELHNYVDSKVDEQAKLSDLILDNLREVVRVFKLNNIPYQAAFGTLLCVVREPDQLMPWDGDADIMVPITYKDLVISALDKDLSDDFYYEYKNKCKDWDSDVLKVCNKAYNVKGMTSLDIYFFIGSPNDPREQKKFEDKVHRCSRLREAKNKYHFYPVEGNILKKIYKRLPYLWGKFYTRDAIESKFNKLVQMYPLGTTEYCMIFGKKAKSKPYIYYTDTMMASYRGVDMPISAYAKERLTLQYGEDFMSQLPIDKRFKEMMFCLDSYKKTHDYYVKHLHKKFHN